MTERAKTVPLYFAYGSNMNEAALRTRAPKARARGLARLARHRFVLMSNGFASVRRDPTSDVYGVLFDLALSDVGPLDRYEAIDQGLYIKVLQPVVRREGMAVKALVYVGNEESGGMAPAGYVRAIIACAAEIGLPPAYIAMLDGLSRGRTASLKATRISR